MTKSCCNNDCEQGRTCPNRKEVDITQFTAILFKYYFTLPAAIVLVAVASLFF